MVGFPVIFPPYKMQNPRPTPDRRIFILTVIIGLTAIQGGLLADTNFVTVNGSFGPVTNDPARSFSLVETAIRALPPTGGTVRIAPGVYRQPKNVVFDHPAILEKDSGAAPGEVVIEGQSGVIATTALSVLTWNCRLFDPDLPFVPVWMDEWRARHVGWYLRLRRSQLDVVALCEVWDFSGEDTIFQLVSNPLRMTDDLVGGLKMLTITEDLSNFPGFRFQKYNDNPGRLKQNSGLAMFSNLPVVSSFGFPDGRYSSPIPVIIPYCDGNDCLADKGWMALKVAKDGFEVYVINTHTQAQDNNVAVTARNNQLAQLATHITEYRNANPHIPVIAMGDFNVIAEIANLPSLSPQLHHTYDIFQQRFGLLGGKDTVRHTPKFERILDERMKGVGGIARSSITTDLIHTDFRGGYTWAPDAIQFGGTLEGGNELARLFDPSPNHRLDYIIYFPSADGKILIDPEKVEVISIKKRFDNFFIISDEVSDHYPLKARFRLTRVH